MCLSGFCMGKATNTGVLLNNETVKGSHMQNGSLIQFAEVTRAFEIETGVIQRVQQTNRLFFTSGIAINPLWA